MKVGSPTEEGSSPPPDESEEGSSSPWWKMISYWIREQLPLQKGAAPINEGSAATDEGIHLSNKKILFC